MNRALAFASAVLLLTSCGGNSDTSVEAAAKPPKPPVTCPPGQAPNPGGQCKPLPPVQCPDGGQVPAGQTCPPVSCPDGSQLPNGSTCPPVDCISGPDVPNGQTCPPVQCPDGSTVPDGQQCPVKPPEPPVDCLSGPDVPAGQTCPPVQCPDGSTVPDGQQCPIKPPPPVDCADGSQVPAGQTCPPVICDDGTQLPNGSQCPVHPPVQTWVPSDLRQGGFAKATVSEFKLTRTPPDYPPSGWVNIPPYRPQPDEVFAVYVNGFGYAAVSEQANPVSSMIDLPLYAVLSLTTGKTVYALASELTGVAPGPGTTPPALPPSYFTGIGAVAAMTCPALYGAGAGVVAGAEYRVTLLVGGQASPWSVAPGAPYLAVPFADPYRGPVTIAEARCFRAP